MPLDKSGLSIFLVIPFDQVATFYVAQVVVSEDVPLGVTKSLYSIDINDVGLVIQYKMCEILFVELYFPAHD